MASAAGFDLSGVSFVMPPGSCYSGRLPRALAYAAVAHAGQRRKDDLATPYIVHPMAVASAVWKHGLSDPFLEDGLEDLVIAGLLHDVAEDAGGRARLDEIESLFGSRASSVVNFASDSLAGDPESKAPWRERKGRHIARVGEVARLSAAGGSPDRGACLVVAADKLDNLSNTADGVERGGDEYLGRFRGGPEGTRWYYGAMFEALRPALSLEVAGEFRTQLARLNAPQPPNG